MKSFLEIWRRIFNALAMNNASDYLSQSRKLTLLSQADTKTTQQKPSLA
ncbi:hypothetical protein [Thiofilum flexile]|nr:hypothetical protein [Thiofilum flexile]